MGVTDDLACNTFAVSSIALASQSCNSSRDKMIDSNLSHVQYFKEIQRLIGQSMQTEQLQARSSVKILFTRALFVQMRAPILDEISVRQKRPQ